MPSYYSSSRSRTTRPNTSFSSRRPSGGGGGGRRNSRKTGPAIHPSRFVKPATPRVDVVAYESTHTFEDFQMHSLLKANAAKRGHTHPTPIQDQSIPLGLAGNNVVGIANTGTGKTVAFGLPVINRLMDEPQSRALIVAPTRELAMQIKDELREMRRGGRIFDALIIGGSSMGRQFADLDRKPQLVIGTPGRIKDHIQRGSLQIGTFNMVVLDEVDRMLDMGFVNDMREILSGLNPERQSFFYSATMDDRVAALINTFTTDAVTVSVKTGETSDNVEQDIMPYETREEKIIQLHALLKREEVGKALVFDETQRSVERLHMELQDRGFKTDAIHGGKSQGQRQRALSKFKRNEINILVATDVAARGIDVADVTHVINYTEPQAYDDYVHRIGRAGRAGRTGFAYTFVKVR